MSFAWAARERQLLAEQNLKPVIEKELLTISLLAEVAELPAEHETGIRRGADMVVGLVSEAGPGGADDAWYNFTMAFYSAVMSTGNDLNHKNLAGLIVAVAECGAASASAEVSQILGQLKGFGWTARDLWNGPKTLGTYQDSPEEAQTSWVNLNRFTAHLSCLQRTRPVEALEQWLEDYGLWTIASGLEDPDTTARAEHIEPAIWWLRIAGHDIFSDTTWGARDGNPQPGVPERDGPLWTARLAEGASQESRWDFWKERLRQIAADNRVPVNTRNLASDALQEMVGRW
ncbi:hypothetical protein B0T26DRAFT_757865 [Lasiosphaeria miniovina]|uniref:Uncharacterized protein n=1 Tax=Lasiosphaeria miniovina TaxID=1954250 RepID=A0AA39ZQP8_9PEZI|nr:uncharacterized protein B0T26DRAFT_757865 [Lasiosphaeria miniovina]KAK0701891.1 hypothetical protein B0T26DRAFT_757865 [Lasiosphaeria miniovina]